MKISKIVLTVCLSVIFSGASDLWGSEDLLPEYGSTADSSDPITLPGTKIEVNGYLNAGGTFNTRGTYGNVASFGSRNEFGLNGAYIALGRGTETNGCGIDWGFGADFMFGADYRAMRTISGWDQDWKTSDDYYYGFSMPQLYAELAYNFWSVQIGRFYGCHGYEAVRADERFFYSVGLAYDSLPATNTGVMVNYNGFDNADIAFGWVAGDDTGFGTDYGQSAFIGSICYHFGDWSSLSWSIQAGRGGLFGVDTDEFINTLVYTARFSPHWGYAFEYDYGSNYRENVAEYHFNALSNYLFYTLNDCWRFGGRMEWLWESGSQQTWELTLGANWTPTSWLTVRPEIRYDNANFARFDDNQTPDQLTVGFDLMATF